MAVDMNLVKLAVDGYRGKVEGYSVEDSQETLRKALVELNGGSTKLNYRNIRDGKCNGLFALIEEIIARTVIEGLTGNEFFMNMVETRNLAEGDSPVFVLEDSELFIVSEMADGTQGIRRQRIAGVEEKTIPTARKGVKIYEELNRVLAGRIDFNQMIDKVSKSMEQKILDETYALWNSATADDFGDAVYFPVAGPYDEDELLEVIAHVEAVSGKTATLVGTKKALRNLAPSIQGAESKSDLYRMGYYGNFYGSPVMAIPQRHAMGSTSFLMDDDIITIIATDAKPIKLVYEGDPLIIQGNPIDNGDLTYEYLATEKWGLGIIVNGNPGIGRYEFT